MITVMRDALLFIAQQGFQDVELNGVRDALQDAGFRVTLCSGEIGDCLGKYGGHEQATVALRDADPAAYDRVALIGGPGAAAYAADDDALAFAERMADTGKPFGAICIAPTILAAAGVLRGKRATVWNQDGMQQRTLEEAGAVYTGEDVTVDGLLVTGNGPDAAAAFGRAFASLPRS
jgi:protease I